MQCLEFKNSQYRDLTSLVIPLEKIDLVSLSDKFAKDIFREFTETITKYMIPASPKEISEVNEFISTSVQGMQDSNELVVAILDKSGNFLGCGGLHGRGNATTPELGIWIKESAHGNGYGKQAVHGLYNWAKSNIVFNYLVYPVDRENIASRRIPESLGGRIFKEVVVQTRSGSTLDEVVYQIFA